MSRRDVIARRAAARERNPEGPSVFLLSPVSTAAASRAADAMAAALFSRVTMPIGELLALGAQWAPADTVLMGILHAVSEKRVLLVGGAVELGEELKRLRGVNERTAVTGPGAEEEV